MRHSVFLFITLFCGVLSNCAAQNASLATSSTISNSSSSSSSSSTLSSSTSSGSYLPLNDWPWIDLFFCSLIFLALTCLMVDTFKRFFRLPFPPQPEVDVELEEIQRL